MSLFHADFKTLLPKHEPQKQKALDFLGADVVARIDLEDFTLLPSDIPAHLLPHLAFIYDVNVNGLSVKEQRKLIEKSFDIHRHLGTGYALKEALKVIGIEAEIIEWYDTNGELAPYYFGLKLKKNDSRGTSFLLNYIERFKNERSRLGKLSDGRCKSKAQYDFSKYDNSVISDVEGLLIDGIRVCFKSNEDKEVAISYEASIYSIPNVAKTSYFFKNRYDNLRYGEKREGFSVTSSTLKNIDKQMKIKRNWQGAWTGHVGDGYRPSFSSMTSVGKNVKLRPTVSSLLEAFVDRESVLEVEIQKESYIDKELRLQRQWQGAWTGYVGDGYTIAIL